MELKLLGTDELKDGFVIFYIDNGEDLNAYIWVDGDGRVRITDIYGLANYCNQASSPLYVGSDIPQEMVENAYKRLADMDKDEKKKLIDSFNERIEDLKENEELYKEKEEYEDSAMEDIAKMGDAGDGTFWFR